MTWLGIFVWVLVSIAVIVDQQQESVVPLNKKTRKAIRRPGKLDCPGLSRDQSQEMVYWQDIPLDHQLHSQQRNLYLTFCMDEGGYNNIRMAYETILAMAHSMGRTLVLPPSQELYLLDSQKNGQRNTFGFQDFFPIEHIDAVRIVSTREFLEQEAMRGNLKDKSTGEIKFPPHNRTVWDGDVKAIENELQPYLESVSLMPDWSPHRCLLAIPANNTTLARKFHAIQSMGGFRSPESYVGSPTAVYGSTIDRLGEVLNGRTELCIYNQTNEHVLHMHGKNASRLLTHFYAFLFFEDWKQDLWTKRFIRDQLRYRDEIQCAAARIVAELRDRYGVFDAFHVRRGEFQYKRTRVSAQEMYDIAKDQIPENATVYIATDERNHRFFDDLGKHYRLLFLDDFRHLLTGVNTNFYGLIDQLVASRSRTFFGCWFSTYVEATMMIPLTLAYDTASPRTLID